MRNQPFQATAPQAPNFSRPRNGFGGFPDDSFRVTYQPAHAGVFTVYLFGVIESASQFIDAIEALSMAGEDDVVQIHLSTDGGSLDATDTFLHAMRECRGRVIVKASGGVHSAGTIILLNADEFTLSENFSCLIHNGFVGPGGKYSDWKVSAKFTEAYMERVIRTTYTGFMSEDEIEACLKGQDFQFTATEFVERWKKREEAEAADELPVLDLDEVEA